MTPNLKKLIDEKLEEFREECQKELGHISGVFMSQGDTKAKDIIMPTKELQEATDRFELYLFGHLRKIAEQSIDSVRNILQKNDCCEAEYCKGYREAIQSSKDKEKKFRS